MKRCWLLVSILLGLSMILSAEPTSDALTARQDMALPDAVVLGDADLAAVFKTPAGLKLRDGFLKMMEAKLCREKLLAFKISELNHLTLSFQAKGIVWDDRTACAVLLLESGQADLFAGLRERFKKEYYQTKKENEQTLVLKRSNSSIWLQAPPGVPGTVLVYADGCLGTPANPLECPVRLGRPRALSALMKEQGKGQMVFGIRFSYQVQSFLDQQFFRDRDRSKLEPLDQAVRDPRMEFLNLDWLLDLETLVVSFESDDKMTMTLAGNFPTQVDAEAAAHRLAGTLGMLCGLVEQQAAESPKDALMAACHNLLQSVKMDCLGRTLKVSLVIPDAMLQYTGNP